MDERLLLQIAMKQEDLDLLKEEAQKYNQPFSAYARFIILKNLEVINNK